ncbi:MAG: PAS domain S-box protein [Flavobacteriales bacterium]|nr:PAS domain S-box protein [Flavobacteriales bacterium]
MSKKPLLPKSKAGRILLLIYALLGLVLATMITITLVWSASVITKYENNSDTIDKSFLTIGELKKSISHREVALLRHLCATDSLSKIAEENIINAERAENTKRLDYLRSLLSDSLGYALYDTLEMYRAENMLAREKLLAISWAHDAEKAIHYHNEIQQKTYENLQNSVSSLSDHIVRDRKAKATALQSNAFALSYTVVALALVVIALLIALGFAIKFTNMHADRMVHRSDLYRKAINQSMIVTVTDSKGRITDSNEQMLKLMGYSKEEVVGKNPRMFKSGHHDKEFYKNLWTTVLAGNVWKGEMLNRVKNGGIVWLDTTIIPFRDEMGKIEEMFVLRQDISARKMAEDELILTNRDLEKRVEERTADLLITSQKLDAIHQDLVSSVNYAKRIQDAVLDSSLEVTEVFPNSFVFAKSHSVLSGDFVWCATIGDLQIIAAVDCTGHGIPGALMSVLGKEILDLVILESELASAGEMLLEMDEQLINRLQIKSRDLIINDGMDVALCIVDQKNGTFQYAGAYRPLITVDNAGISTYYKGSSFSIGGGSSRHDKTFETITIPITPDLMFYIGSDGFQDQFGGTEDKKFGKARLTALLSSISSLPIKQQQAGAKEAFINWQGKATQTDDVLLVGIRL